MTFGNWFSSFNRRHVSRGGIDVFETLQQESVIDSLLHATRSCKILPTQSQPARLVNQFFRGASIVETKKS
jgi:hypothetical protein